MRTPERIPSSTGTMTSTRRSLPFLRSISQKKSKRLPRNYRERHDQVSLRQERKKNKKKILNNTNQSEERSGPEPSANRSIPEKIAVGAVTVTKSMGPATTSRNPDEADILSMKFKPFSHSRRSSILCSVFSRDKG